VNIDRDIVVTIKDCEDLRGNSHGRWSRSFKNGFDQVMTSDPIQPLWGIFDGVKIEVEAIDSTRKVG
jgi:hypothetical protein